MKISRKVAIVYLLTIAPLLLLGIVLLYEWYNANLALVESDRLNNARLVATAFETFTRDLSGASKALGEATLDNPPASPTASRFTVMSNAFPLYFSAVLDRDGRVVYASDAGLIGRSIEDTAVAEAEAGANIAIGDSRSLDGRVGFFLAQSLLDASGEREGVAVQFIDPERLARRLTRNPLTGGGASIVDSSGTLVVLFEEPEVGLEQQYWGDEKVVADALDGMESVDHHWVFPLDNQRRIGAGVPVGRLGWEASSAIRYDIALAPFRRSLTLAIGVGILIMVVSGSAAGLMARSLLGSVAALREQSLTVGDRDREPADVVRSGDELEDVSRVLQETDRELRSYITGLEAIGEAGRTLSAAIGAGEVDQAIIDSACVLFGAHAVWVLLYDERTDRLELAVWHSDGDAPRPELSIKPGVSVAGRVFRTGEVAIVTDVRAIGDISVPKLKEDYGIASMVEVPLERGGRPYGVLGISAPGIETWLPRGREVALLRTFGTEVTTVLENARLYENERFIADTLQQSLLTIPDKVPGLVYAHAYHAATQTARVGGDFYDIFELEDRVGIVMGDVAGHGLDAAVLTSLVKNAVRAHADEPGKSPAEVVELTNELIVKESRPESFVTLFVAVLDRSTGAMTYCNAGHTTAVILRRDGKLSLLRSTSMLVGAFPRIAFEEAVTTMAEGDLILLYTDGLTEARRAGELYGEKRLVEFLGGLGERTAAELVGDVIDEVMAYTNGELSDDLALLAVQRV